MGKVSDNVRQFDTVLELCDSFRLKARILD